MEDLHNLSPNIPKTETHVKTQEIWNNLRSRHPNMRFILDPQYISLLFKPLPNKDDGIFRGAGSPLHDHRDEPNRVHSGNAG